MKIKIILATAVLFAVAGCSGGGDSIKPNSPDEQKAIDAENAMTPEQKIDQINKGPMSPAAKEAAIKKIKDASGTK